MCKYYFYKNKTEFKEENENNQDYKKGYVHKAVYQLSLEIFFQIKFLKQDLLK